MYWFCEVFPNNPDVTRRALINVIICIFMIFFFRFIWRTKWNYFPFLYYVEMYFSFHLRYAADLTSSSWLYERRQVDNTAKHDRSLIIEKRRNGFHILFARRSGMEKENWKKKINTKSRQISLLFPSGSMPFEKKKPSCWEKSLMKTRQSPG